MQKFLRFPEWKTKAITLSYDDGVVFDEKLISIMKKYGLKGTFNINAGMMNENCYRRLPETKVAALYSESGMEIAMHGFNHEYTAGCTGSDIVKEYADDKIYLEKRFSQIIRGGAYAFGIYTDDIVNVLKMLGLSYFRTTKNSESFDLPTDWLRLAPTCKHTSKNLFDLLDNFLKQNPNNTYSAQPLLFYLWGHSYEFEDNGNWEIIEEFGKKVCNEKNIWHVTNAQLYDYVKAYNDLIFSSDGNMVINNSCLDVYLWLNRRNVVVKAGGSSVID